MRVNIAANNVDVRCLKYAYINTRYLEILINSRQIDIKY